DRVKGARGARGFKPVADPAGWDYRSFHVKDPAGFDVAVTNGTKALRRKTPATAKVPAPAPFEPTGWTTLYLDHISFEVPDYRRSAAFYEALLGWTMRLGSGAQASVQIGDIGGALTPRNRPPPATPPHARARAGPPRP